MYQTVTSDKEKKGHIVKFNQLNRNLQVYLQFKIIFFKDSQVLCSGCIF